MRVAGEQARRLRELRMRNTYRRYRPRFTLGIDQPSPPDYTARGEVTVTFDESQQWIIGGRRAGKSARMQAWYEAYSADLAAAVRRAHEVSIGDEFPRVQWREPAPLHQFVEQSDEYVRLVADTVKAANLQPLVDEVVSDPEGRMQP